MTMTQPTAPVDTGTRRIPVGAELVDGGGVHFRVWAPKRHRVAVVLEAGPGAPAEVELAAEDGGYFSGVAMDARAGTRYRYRLDGGDAFPDPVSRFQPDGPHGPSQLIDPSSFRWNDANWKGVKLPGQVIYEMHIGTFTAEGTWAAAAREFTELASAGI